MSQLPRGHQSGVLCFILTLGADPLDALLFFFNSSWLQLLGSRWQGISSLSGNQAQRQGSFIPTFLGSKVGASVAAVLLPFVPQPFVDLGANTPQGMTHQAVAPPSCKKNVLISPHPRVPLRGSCQPRKHHILHNLSQPRAPRHPPWFPTPGPTYLPVWGLQKWSSAAGYQLGWRNDSRRNSYMADVEIM